MIDGLAYIIIISTACALFGVVIGAAIQRSAKFLYPTDWMSITLAVVVLIDLVLLISPWEKLWYLPFSAGFIVGYLLVGRQKYIIVANISVTSKHLILRPWVLYEKDNKICRQRQTNRDLIRRQFLGIHNYILDMDGNPPQISPDWVSNAKYPLFPKFVTEMLVLEDMVEKHVTTQIWWRIRGKKTTTHICVAHASSASKLELLRSVDILSNQQDTISKLYGQIHDYQNAQGSKLLETALRIQNNAIGTSPENRMYDLMRKKDEMSKTKKEETADPEESEHKNKKMTEETEDVKS